ncbi:hypothetical protein AVL62_13900 [Serinicoccus chungangensis]|uniref:DUF2470 domain-containing protein n=1 Tax=Serinicoccus chungangensis TaxID=767452 RepID=A0A0W8I3G6_9MICO|nr:hypothetical protein AVL62_13900 [Serinicoccus chungangensis]
MVDRLREATTRSTAARLVHGAGRATVVAYRDDPDRSLHVLAHGLTAADVPVVALPADSLDPSRSCREVRLRIDRHGADPRTRVSVASLHALAHLRIMDEGETRAMSSLGLLPPEVDWPATSGAQVALLCLDRLLLHDQAGVTPMAFAEVVDPPCFPARAQEWLCRDAVEELGAGRIGQILDEVVCGSREGLVGPGHPTPPSMSPVVGQRVLADVDSTGCTWLEVGTASTRTVFVPFDASVRCLEDLQAALGSLAQPAV